MEANAGCLDAAFEAYNFTRRTEDARTHGYCLSILDVADEWIEMDRIWRPFAVADQITFLSIVHVILGDGLSDIEGEQDEDVAEGVVLQSLPTRTKRLGQKRLDSRYENALTFIHMLDIVRGILEDCGEIPNYSFGELAAKLASTPLSRVGPLLDCVRRIDADSEIWWFIYPYDSELDRKNQFVGWSDDERSRLWGWHHTLRDASAVRDLTLPSVLSASSSLPLPQPGLGLPLDAEQRAAQPMPPSAMNAVVPEALTAEDADDLPNEQTNDENTVEYRAEPDRHVIFNCTSSEVWGLLDLLVAEGFIDSEDVRTLDVRLIKCRNEDGFLLPLELRNGVPAPPASVTIDWRSNPTCLARLIVHLIDKGRLERPKVEHFVSEHIRFPRWKRPTITPKAFSDFMSQFKRPEVDRTAWCHDLDGTVGRIDGLLAIR